MAKAQAEFEAKTKAELEQQAMLLVRRSSQDGWLLGRILAELRANDIGGYCKGKYTQFGDFCEQELGISRQQATRTIKVSALFTQDECKKWGWSNVRMGIGSAEQLKVLRQLLDSGLRGQTLARELRNWKPVNKVLLLGKLARLVKQLTPEDRRKFAIQLLEEGGKMAAE